MFGIAYTDTVTIRRAKAGTMGVGGRPEFVQVLNEDDETAVRIQCRIEERGRVTIDARSRQIKTDATLLYRPQGKATLQTEDLVVRDGDRAYEVVGLEAVRGPWGAGEYSRVDLVKTAMPVPEDRHGS